MTGPHTCAKVALQVLDRVSHQEHCRSPELLSEASSSSEILGGILGESLRLFRACRWERSLAMGFAVDARFLGRLLASAVLR